MVCRHSGAPPASSVKQGSGRFEPERLSLSVAGQQRYQSGRQDETKEEYIIGAFWGGSMRTRGTASWWHKVELGTQMSKRTIPALWIDSLE